MKELVRKWFLFAISFNLTICLVPYTVHPSLGQSLITIGTGGTGGIYYPYGGGVAQIWTKYVPGIKAETKITDGSVENVKLAHKGECVIGEAMADIAVAAYKGVGDFEGKMQNILAMTIMYPSMLQIVTLKKSGITNIEQVKGRRISTGSPGSGTHSMAETVFKALGIPLDSYSDSCLSFADNAAALRGGTIEAGFFCVGPCASSIQNLAVTHDISIIPFTQAQQKKILAVNSEYSTLDLAGGLYRGVEDPVPTIGVWNVMICQRSLDKENEPYPETYFDFPVL